MTTQTNLDLTDKQPTALMRLEDILNDRFVDEKSLLHRERNYTIKMVLHIINELKPSELADLMQSFCEGGIETESAETWSKKWGVKETVKSEWIEFNSNKDLFNIAAKNNCECLFDDGSIVRFKDKHPMAVLTHFKNQP
jgi:hypothetical protein